MQHEYIHDNGQIYHGGKVVYTAPEPVLAYRKRTRLYVGPVPKGQRAPKESWHILVMKSCIAFVFEKTHKVAILPAFIDGHPLFHPIDDTTVGPKLVHSF